MDKSSKKKYIFTMVIIFFLTIAAFKIREHYILKDRFVFSKDNIVKIWTSKSDTHSYINSHISEEDISSLSKLLTDSKVKKSSVKESPAPDNMGNILLLLDGNIRENKDDSVSVEYKRSILLSKINDEKVYVILQLNKLRDDDSFNMDGVLQKFYTINSKDLVNLIEKIDNTKSDSSL